MNKYLEDKLEANVLAFKSKQERATEVSVALEQLSHAPLKQEAVREQVEIIISNCGSDFEIYFSRFVEYSKLPLPEKIRDTMPKRIEAAILNLYTGQKESDRFAWQEELHWACLYWPDHKRMLFEAITKNTAFEYKSALKYAVEFERPRQEEAVEDGFVAKKFTITEFLEYPDHPPELIPKLFYKGEAHLLAGISAAGKTTVSLRILLDIALGKPALGTFAKGEAGKVIYVSAEDRAEATIPRLRSMLAERTADAERLLENFSFIDLTSVSSFLHARDPDNRDALIKNALFKSLNEHFKAERPALVILDPLVAFFAGNENDNNQAAIFMKDLRNLAEQSGVAMLLIHHVSKADGRGGEYDQWAARGASAFVSNCRRTFQVATPQSRTFKANGVRWRIPQNITDEQMLDGRVMMLIEHKDSYMKLWSAPLVILRTHGFELEAFPCERDEGDQDGRADQNRRDDQLVLEFLRARFAAGGDPVTSKLIRDITIGSLSQSRKQSSFNRMQDQGYFFMRQKAGTSGQEAFALNEELIAIGEPF